MRFYASLIVVSACLYSCADTSTVPDPKGTGTVYTMSDYTIRPTVGSSITLGFTTINITEAGDTSRIVGSEYRYTVINPSFPYPVGKTSIAVQRETLTNGLVRLTDTVYHMVDNQQFMVYERLSDTIGRRRLKAPLEVGTVFFLRDVLGSVESNKYTIMDLASNVVTPIRTFSSCIHVRMSTSTAYENGTRYFSDEQWLAPSHSIVRQLQTTRDQPDVGNPSITYLEFILVARSW